MIYGEITRLSVRGVRDHWHVPSYRRSIFALCAFLGSNILIWLLFILKLVLGDVVPFNVLHPLFTLVVIASPFVWWRSYATFNAVMAVDRKLKGDEEWKRRAVERIRYSTYVNSQPVVPWVDGGGGWWWLDMPSGRAVNLTASNRPGGATGEKT